ncbi:MAG: hypothetical protein MUE46_10185 [Xanthomonadales bacterium]|nr:hypothetical protein [Xanthomonadales bacterium]
MESREADEARLAAYGLAGGAVEIGAGAIVHGIDLPLGGLAMVSAQCVLLTRAAEGLHERPRVAWVGLLAAGLKALAPAGRRLRPMLAIAMQAWAYALALRLFGWNRVAVIVGGLLMGTWSGAQGLLLQWLWIGSAWFAAAEKLVAGLAGGLGTAAPPLPVLLAVYLLLHALGVALVAALAWGRRAEPVELPTAAPSALQGLLAPRAAEGWFASGWRALPELLRLGFLAPLAIVLGALAAGGTEAEALFWIALRALTVCWLLCVLLRRVDPNRLTAALHRWGWHAPARLWERVLGLIGGVRN